MNNGLGVDILSNEFGEIISHEDGHIIRLSSTHFNVMEVMHNYYMTRVGDEKCYLARRETSKGNVYGLLIYKTFQCVDRAIGSEDWKQKMENVNLVDMIQLKLIAKKLFKGINNIEVLSSKFSGENGSHELGVFIRCSDVEPSEVFKALFIVHTLFNNKGAMYSKLYDLAYQSSDELRLYINSSLSFIDSHIHGDYIKELKNWEEIHIELNGESATLYILPNDDSIDIDTTDVRNRITETAKLILYSARVAHKKCSIEQAIGWAAWEEVPIRWALKRTNNV